MKLIQSLRHTKKSSYIFCVNFTIETYNLRVTHFFNVKDCLVKSCEKYLRPLYSTPMWSSPSYIINKIPKLCFRNRASFQFFALCLCSNCVRRNFRYFLGILWKLPVFRVHVFFSQTRRHLIYVCVLYFVEIVASRIRVGKRSTHECT